MGTLPQALFFPEKRPHISGSPEFVGTLPQAHFFQKNGPHIFGSPELVGTLPQALFFSRKMPPHIFGLNKSGVYRAQSGVKNKKFTPIYENYIFLPMETFDIKTSDKSGGLRSYMMDVCVFLC